MPSTPTTTERAISVSSTTGSSVMGDKDEIVTPSPSSTRKILGRPPGSRSKRELELEQEVNRLTTKRSAYKQKKQHLKYQYQKVIIEKEVTIGLMKRELEVKDQSIRQLGQQNQALHRQGVHFRNMVLTRMRAEVPVALRLAEARGGSKVTIATRIVF